MSFVKRKSGRYHLIFDLVDVSSGIVNNKEGLALFIKELAKIIKMKIIYGPVVVDGVPTDPGITGFAIVDLSHISVHTFSGFNEVMVDIFSCQPYDRAKARKAILNYFKVSYENMRAQEVFWG